MRPPVAPPVVRPLVGEWMLGYNSPSPVAYASVVSLVKSGGFMEFVVLDEGGAERGSVVAQIIGQGIDAHLGIGIIYISPVAAESAELVQWSIRNLSAPNGIHLRAGSAAGVLLDGGESYVLAVDAWRIRELASFNDIWNQHLQLGFGALPTLPLDEPPVVPAVVREPALPPPAVPDAHADADFTMQQLRRIGDDLLRGQDPRVPGRDDTPEPLPAARRERPAVAPCLDEVLAGAHARARAARALPGDRGRGLAGAAGGDRRASPPAPEVELDDVCLALEDGLPPGQPEEPWADAAARLFFNSARADHAKKEPGDWSVSERLAARSGRRHTLRVARRIGKGLTLPVGVEVPESEDEHVLPKRHRRSKKRRHRSRGRRRRPSSSSSRGRRRRRSGSNSSSTSSRSSNRDFREASTVGVNHSRASRESSLRPHVVLVDTLYSMARVLPRTSAEACSTRADVFRTLPPVLTPWFELKLMPLLAAGQQSLRSEREARTLVEMGGALLQGQILPYLMLLLGRLKAITEAHTPGSTWATARHYEVTATQGAGILTQRDRANAMRDQADQLRVTRGAAPPAAANRG